MTGPRGSGRTAADLALDALRNGGAGRPAVTSLSVDEILSLDQVDLEPVGMLTGASVVQVATLARLGVGFSDNGELVKLSTALEASRVRAVDRLTEAATRAGAEGVVGVFLDIGDLGTEASLVHLAATGTAVRSRGKSHRSGPVFTAALSGQEVHLLHRGGYRPLGIVSGTCVYHVGRQGFGSWAGSVKLNQEMTIYTEALYDARELAMGRLQDRALALGADGVVGVTLTERTGVWGSHVIEFAALGTAMVSEDGNHRPLDPRLVMDLADVKRA